MSRRCPGSGGAWLRVLMLVACLAGSQPVWAEHQEIRIGLNAEITGSIPVVGQSARKAARLAVDEANAAGGLEVGGHRYPVRLVVEDNEDRPAAAVAVAQKLIYQDRVLAMVGPNASRDAIPAAAAAEAARTVMISPWSTNPKTTEGKRYVFRAAFTDDFQGRVVASFVRHELGAETAAVLFDVASEYNVGVAQIFRDAFTALGGDVVAFESYTTGDKDFTSQLTKIRAARPDVLFLPNYYSEVPLQVQQAHQLGLDIPMVGSDSWGSRKLLELGGEDMEGLFFTTHYAVDTATPAARRFIAAYRERYHEDPDDVAALTYDSFQLLFHALRAAGRPDRAALREALARTRGFQGVTGTFQFPEGSGDPVKSAVIIQIRQGDFRYYGSVEP